jgi:hypothetical protein
MLKELIFIGMCDASGASALSDALFAVANDEDNILRVYDADKGGGAIAEYDVSRSLNLPVKTPKKRRKKRNRRSSPRPISSRPPASATPRSG